ncbi:hypothetical protein Bsp3421_001565 [Burkholderia sp. FERM BP-3421]|uniref:hypothetical protein n=1 Tax=Burkholderia sp. FERM BP-3421 TaxID=1494466 RepID=UPI002362D2C5|nr:hypothetical protein [Burkholderia sp. FERM BP-3421]WDD91629.1 hypothetical protein Bsp3421_001565 [Burkholderia sp. FERM BP-3421]
MRSLACSLALLLCMSAAHAGATRELRDYLIQDVCVDADDNPIAGDPASCPSHRDMRVGERSPYLLTDFDHNSGAAYQSTNSIPVLGADGTTKVLVMKNLQGGFDSRFRFSFSEVRDGYDLIDLDNSSYASFIRTSDPGCRDQIWSRTGGAGSIAERAGGWILFPFQGPPSGWPPSSSIYHPTYHIQVTQPAPAGCGDGNSTGVTYWNGPGAYQFESGKVMTAIRSDHFAATTLSQRNNALERYFFTKEYGMTRWEAWIPRSRCYAERGAQDPSCHPETDNEPLRARCKVLNVSGTGHAGLDRWGDQDWVRVDCRDASRYVALDTPQYLLDDQIARRQVVDLDARGSTNPPLGAWHANSPAYGHVTGRANGTGWEIPATGQYSNLSYGPYVQQLPAGRLNATFLLKVDVTAAHNDDIADLDVYRWSTNTVFAKRKLMRADFNDANTVQAFIVPFDYDGQGALEFRVHVYGHSYVYHAGSLVGY